MLRAYDRRRRVACRHRRGARGALDIPFTALDRIHGLAATDRLLDTLSAVSGRPVPEAQRRRRRILVDTLATHTASSPASRRACARHRPCAVALRASRRDGRVPHTGGRAHRGIRHRAHRCRAGHRRDFASVEAGAGVLLSGSHAHDRAALLGMPLLEIGFPSHHTFGAPPAGHCGYSGAALLVNDIATALVSGATNGEE